MTDEVEVEEEDEPYVCDGSGESEYVEVEGAQIIAPRGWGEFVDFFGAAAVRVRLEKGGTIEVLVNSGDTWRWQDPTKADRTSGVARLTISPKPVTKD